MAFDVHDPHTGADASDLAWLAFAYATDGLDPESSAAFEARLDADQSAREALAEAVLLAGSVALAAGAERRRRRLSLGVAALATAACLALAASPRLFSSKRTDGPAPAVATAAAAAANPEAVALAWSGLRHETEAGSGNGNGPDADDLIEGLAEPADALPPWLLEAAALPAADEGRGS